jgi:hypothetical protein
MSGICCINTTYPFVVTNLKKNIRIMKKLIKTPFIVILLLTLFSFTRITELDFVGTYGASENDPARIELRLNKDKTFTYKDLSNPDKQIDVKGNWEAKNNEILLKNYDLEFSFHTKWKISEDGMIAKSRKGMTFYTLGKQ